MTYSARPSAKPIDIIAKYIHGAEDGQVDVEAAEPYTLVNTLTVDELEHLNEDIKVYKEIERVWQFVTHEIIRVTAQI